MPEIQPPAPPYVGPPKWHGSSTNKPISRVVIHCTAGSEPGVPGAARATAKYTKSTSRPSSWHYCADSKESVQLTYDSVVAYHDGTNSHSIGYELSCSLSNEGAGHWDRDDHKAMLLIAAADVARLCLAYGVPIKRLSTSEIRAGAKGICGHNDMRLAFPGSTSHWDPGPHFPWVQFLALVQAAAKDLQETPEPEPRPTRRVKGGQVSMQFSDAAAEMEADTDAIFTRARNKGFAWVTGTEAGREPLQSLLHAAAQANGFRFYRCREEWVAVDRSLVKGGWETGWVPVLESHEGQGRHSDRGIAWVSFDTADLGRITIGSGHYLTDGRKPGDPNYALNLRMSEAIGQWAREKGAGSALVFYGGDQNINDRTDDTFHGAPLTSAQDELRKYDNAGHGPIEVIASFNADGRVSAVDVRSLDDEELSLFTDHDFIVAVFEVRVLA